MKEFAFSVRGFSAWLHRSLEILLLLWAALLAATMILFAAGCSTAPRSTEVHLAPLGEGLDRLDGHLSQIERAKPAEVKPIVREAKGTVATMRVQLATAQEEVKRVIGQRDWWQNDAQNAKEDLKHEKLATARYQGKLRLIGLILAGVSALLAFSLLARLSAYLTAVAPAAMPYFLALRLGAAGMVFVSVFSWVRYW